MISTLCAPIPGIAPTATGEPSGQWRNQPPYVIPAWRGHLYPSTGRREVRIAQHVSDPADQNSRPQCLFGMSCIP